VSDQQTDLLGIARKQIETDQPARAAPENRDGLYTQLCQQQMGIVTMPFNTHISLRLTQRTLRATQAIIKHHYIAAPGSQPC
jgi:hypothetical protein